MSNAKPVEPSRVQQRPKGMESKDGFMGFRPFVVVVALIGLAGCGQRSDGHAVQPAPAVSPPMARALSGTGAAHGSGSLTPLERSLALRVARHQQREVTGTFIGATAFATRGTPFDPGSACDIDERFVNVRLVWKADANFVHSHPPGSPPDGPRKDLLVTVDPSTAHICEIGAGYRNVGAAPTETLLYGQWPGRAKG